MSSHPQSSPNGSNPWPAIILFFAAIGVPGSAALAFADKVSKNPWQAFALALLYELALVILAFLRSVWQHLEEDWSKDTATWVNNLVQQRWFSYTSYYGRFLTFQYRDFDVKGLSTQSMYTLELEQVFVDLSLDPKLLQEVAPSSLHVQVPKELLVKNHALWTYLAADVLKNQQIVVLGAPGSGKTTLLKHLALTLVNRRKKRALAYPLRRLYGLPFLLFLREHAKTIQENPHFSLVDAIEEKLRLWEREVPDGWVRGQLRKGGCLVLLDGLDEVAEVAVRKQVVKWVEQQMIAYGGQNRFVITSRPFGYRDNALGGVMVLEARPFTFEQVQHFVQNWYRTNEVMSSQKDDRGVRMRADAGAQDLLRRIQQTPALTELAVNPLLLTMIATIHRYRSTLPGKRVELYAEISDVFLGKRQQARDIEIEITPAQCRTVLQPLAYEMMVRQSREIPANEAQEIIEEPLRLVHGQMAPEAFLKMIENMSGLLLEREQGMYSFAHLTFQEYFAATFIRERHQETVLITHIGESWWEETARLYCAQTDATAIITTCLKKAASSVAYLVLALECYEEAHQVQPAIKTQIDSLLAQGAEDIDSTRRNVVAEVLLRRRLKEMVPVRDGVYRDTSLLTHVEYQLFVDEQHTLGLNYQLEHWNSAQFPTGQALLPVVGVRPSDSEAFCRWLTEREPGGVWKYRLPELKEPQPKEVLLRPSWLPPYTRSRTLGYWEEKEHIFLWIKPKTGSLLGNSLSEQGISVAPLDLDAKKNDSDRGTIVLARSSEMYASFFHYIDLASVSVNASDFAGASLYTVNLVFADTSKSSLAQYLARARARARDLARARSLASGLASDLAIARDLAGDLARDVARARDPSLTGALVRASDSARASARDVANDLARAQDLARDLVLDLASDLTSASASILPRNLARTRANQSSLASDLACELTHASREALQLVRVETAIFLPIAKILVLLSICMSFSAYDLANTITDTSALVWWKHLFPFTKRKRGPDTDLQLMLNQGIAIYQKIERLERRIQGKEDACEGILIVKEREEIL